MSQKRCSVFLIALFAKALDTNIVLLKFDLINGSTDVDFAVLTKESRDKALDCTESAFASGSEFHSFDA